MGSTVQLGTMSSEMGPFLCFPRVDRAAYILACACCGVQVLGMVALHDWNILVYILGLVVYGLLLYGLHQPQPQLLCMTDKLWCPPSSTSRCSAAGSSWPSST